MRVSEGLPVKYRGKALVFPTHPPLGVSPGVVTAVQERQSPGEAT